MKMNKYCRIFLLAGLLVLMVGHFGLACNVPVFRYALERWPADSYKITVILDEEADEAESALIKELKDLERVGYEIPAAEVDVFTGTNGLPKPIRAWVTKNPEQSKPFFLVQYPRAMQTLNPFWAGALTHENIVLLKDSPARRQILNHLVKNSTAVWLLLKSSDPKANEDLKLKLSTILTNLEETLELPEAFLEEITEEEAASLKIQFPIVEITRGEAAEEFFANSVYALDDKIKDLNVPLAIPIFGRGRALAIFVPKDVQEDYISEACYFMTGPCSCEVKSGNPGFDLFIPVEWDEYIDGTMIVDEDLPPLTGLSAFTPKEPEAATEEEPIEEDVKEDAVDEEPVSGLSPVILSIAVTAGIVIILLLVLTLRMKNSKLDA